MQWKKQTSTTCLIIIFRTTTQVSIKNQPFLFLVPLFPIVFKFSNGINFILTDKTFSPCSNQLSKQISPNRVWCAHKKDADNVFNATEFIENMSRQS